MAADSSVTQDNNSSHKDKVSESHTPKGNTPCDTSNELADDTLPQSQKSTELSDESFSDKYSSLNLDSGNEIQNKKDYNDDDNDDDDEIMITKVTISHSTPPLEPDNSNDSNNSTQQSLPSQSENNDDFDEDFDDFDDPSNVNSTENPDDEFSSANENGDEEDDFGDFDDFADFEEGEVADESFDFTPNEDLPQPLTSPQDQELKHELPTAFSIITVPCLNEKDFSNSAHLQASIEQILTSRDGTTTTSGFAYTLTSANNTQITVTEPKAKLPSALASSFTKNSLSDEEDDDEDEDLELDHNMNNGSLNQSKLDSQYEAGIRRSDTQDSSPSPTFELGANNTHLSYFTVRSQSLWDQLALTPTTPSQTAANLTDWKRSAIRRFFLVSLGVPVDLDEVNPHKGKQKRLILPGSNTSNQQYQRQAQHNKSISIATIQSNASTSDQSGTLSNPISRQGTFNDSNSAPGGSNFSPNSSTLNRTNSLAIDNEDETFSEWSRMASVSDIAIKNMNAEELSEYIRVVALALDAAKTTQGQWLARRDDALKDKAAFEGVIENLVDYAQRVGKSSSGSSSNTTSSSSGGSGGSGGGGPGGGPGGPSSGHGSPRVSVAGPGGAGAGGIPGGVGLKGSVAHHKKNLSTLGRANSFLRRKKAES